MKNKLIKGVFGLIIGLSSIAIIAPVSAESLDSIEEGNNSVNVNVTVGKVEVPVYDVEIQWDSLKYDWKYDEETRSFKWTPTYRTHCFETHFYDTDEQFWSDNYRGRVYTDDTCQVKLSEDATFQDILNGQNNGTQYYIESEPFANDEIRIYNYSSNTKDIGASLRWNSTNNYKWTTAEFVNSYSISVCKEITSSEMFEQVYSFGLFNDSTCDYNNMASSDASYGDGNTYYFSTYETGTVVLPDGELTLENIGGVGVGGMWCNPEDDDYEECLLEHERLDRYKYGYSVRLGLKVDSSKEIITPTLNEVIGSVTITIKEINE